MNEREPEEVIQFTVTIRLPVLFSSWHFDNYEDWERYRDEVVSKLSDEDICGIARENYELSDDTVELMQLSSGPEYKPEYYSADGYPVWPGKKFWNNDLRVCQVTGLAAYSNDYQRQATQTWHQTTHGSFDTLDGYLQYIGRLTRHYEGKDAEDFETGTNYKDVK